MSFDVSVKTFALTFALLLFIFRLFYNKYGHGLGQFHTKTIELHRKYGKLVRIAPNVVDVGDPTMIPVIYNNRGNFRKVAILNFSHGELVSDLYRHRFIPCPV